MAASPFTAQALTGAALDVFWSLYRYGPSEDGDVPSKVGRDQLVELGLAARHNGINWLTSDGTIAAIDAGYAERKYKAQREARKGR